jgi:hypothetical protein
MKENEKALALDYSENDFFLARGEIGAIQLSIDHLVWNRNLFISYGHSKYVLHGMRRNNKSIISRDPVDRL